MTILKLKIHDKVFAHCTVLRMISDLVYSLVL